MIKNIKIDFLDCMLRGKFTRAGETATQLFLKDTPFSAKAELEKYLNCEAMRSRSSGVLLKFSISTIHVKSAIKATRAIIDCMSDSDQKLFFRFSHFQLFSIFRSLCSVEYAHFIKVLKYFTAYPLAHHLQNDLPEAPCDFDSKYPFVGNNAIRKWWKERMMSSCHTKRNLRLFWSLLQGVKRACEFADDSFIHASMLKHKDALSRTHPIDEALEARYMNEYSDFFGTYCENKRYRFKTKRKLKYEMSNSSCWEYTRSQGGQRGYLLDYVNGVHDSQFQPLDEDNPKGYDWDIWAQYRRCIVQSDKSNYLHMMIEISPGKVKELRGTMTPSFETLMELKGDRGALAMVQAILEPLKVRLITKGPAAKYFLAKTYQKDLFKYLRKLPQFELIGTPLRKDHIYRMIEREKNIPDMTFSHFVSGDYSAATDNLGQQYCHIGILESLQASGVVGTQFSMIIQDVILSHEIHYPPKFEIEKFDQTNGQLMGSPLSFPFLCLANLIAYKLSLEDYTYKKSRFKDLPCLINGDDILFRTNPEHYEIWKEHVANVGFSLSVGKNYIHEKILTINSTMFSYDQHTTIDSEGVSHSSNKLSEIEYCNFGLLSGTSKLGGSRGEVREKALDLCDAYTRSVGGATDKPLAFSRFITRNREDIQKITMNGRYNLFLPRELGGLGFEAYDGINFHVTRFQRLLAKSVLKNADLKPLFGFKTTNKSNMVCGYESKNKKRMICGIGPLPYGYREISTKEYNVANTAYNIEATTKWFTRIPLRYNAAKLFPFRLKESDTLDYQKLRFVEACYPDGLVPEERKYCECPLETFFIY